MHKRLKTYQLAAIFGAVVIASAAPSFSAAAPLCRQVLQSFTPEQIDSAITDFANLSRYVDQLQVTGTTDAKYTSARNAQKAKEQELLSTLNISRDELRRIVKEKNDTNNIKQARATRKESKSRDNQELLIRPLKAVLKNSIPINIASGHTQALADNGRHLAIIDKLELQLIDLVSGDIKAYDNNVSHQIGDSILSFDSMTKEQMIFTNLSDGQRKTILLGKPDHIVRSEDKNSVLTYNVENGEFKYVAYNSNGDVTYNGSTTTKQIEMPYLKLFLGEYAIIKDSTNNSFYLLSLKTNNVTILPLNKWDNFSGIPGTNSLLIQNFQRTTFEVLDLDYLVRTKHEFDDTTDVIYIDKDIAWVENQDNRGVLQKILLNDLAAPKDQVEVGDWASSSLEDMPNTPFLVMSEQSSESTSLELGIYRKNDLSSALALSELYSKNKPDRAPVKMWVSKDAKTMVVFSRHISEDPAKLGIEIWSLEKR